MLKTDKATENSFWEELKSIPGGENLESCIQCGTCTGSCPTSRKMDYTPRKIIAMIRAGMKEEILCSNAIWLCVSCYSCTARCPRGIQITDLMYALKNLSMKYGCSRNKGEAPVFYRLFNRLVEKSGRLNESRLIVESALRTNPTQLIGLTRVGIMMMLRRRLPIFHASIENKQELRDMLTRLREG
ncbi:MAG: heterodisulfide reductase, partial [Peptococcaceae bacterium]|nr:heterodisulfide reductase [Peptococcaceae bacterium]